MSASQEQRAEWLGTQFWERLERLKTHPQRVQPEHEGVRRDLEQVTPREADELRLAWRSYCEVIAELAKTTPELNRG